MGSGQDERANVGGVETPLTFAGLMTLVEAGVLTWARTQPRDAHPNVLVALDRQDGLAVAFLNFGEDGESQMRVAGYARELLRAVGAVAYVVVMEGVLESGVELIVLTGERCDGLDATKTFVVTRREDGTRELIAQPAGSLATGQWLDSPFTGLLSTKVQADGQRVWDA